MIEIVIVLMVGVILMSVAAQSLSGVRSRQAVRQAQYVFVAMHARTRAQAIEHGERVLLRIDPVGDSVWIERDGNVLETVRLRAELGVDLQGGTSVHTLCMNPRGFAEPSCNSFPNPLELSFVQGAAQKSVTLLSLGQVLY